MIITKEKYKTTRWSGGLTHQLYIYPENADYAKRDFLFRISMAEAQVEDSDYTYLEGVDRYLVSLDGECTLTHGDGSSFQLLPFGAVAHFSGEVPTHAHGAIRDFNLMLKGGAKGEMLVVGKGVFQINKHSVIAVYSEGKAKLEAEGGHQYNLDSGELLLIKNSSVHMLNVLSCTEKLILCVVDL